VPEPVPDFALRAEEIYRLEVGAAFFVACYLVTMTFLLALSGRGFAEVGTSGLKIQDVVERSEAHLRKQTTIDRQTRKTLAELGATVNSVKSRVALLEERLDALEARR
jgi:hypothetical protein